MENPRRRAFTEPRRTIVNLVVAMVLLIMGTTEGLSAQDPMPGWAEPINFSNIGDLFSNTPVLLCDGNQNTHMFWVERNDQQASIYYRSDVSGSWSDPTDIMFGPRVNILDAAITSDGRVHLVWATGNSGELVYSSAPLAEAHDPRKWSRQHSLENGVDVLSDVYGGGNSLYADSGGVLHLVYGKANDSDGLSHTLYYVRSEDSGNSWSSPVPVTTIVAPEPSSISGNIAVDEVGRLHVAWDVRSNQYAAFSQLGYIRSTDAGKTWGNELELATGQPPFGVAMAAVFAFGNDEIHLTWDTPDRLHRWSTDGGETWSAPTPIIALGAAFGGFNKLAKDTAGILHVVAAVGNGVYHAAWSDGAWRQAEAIDTREFDPHGQQFVICQGNRLHVAYYDRTAENEIWYSYKTVNAPAIARTTIAVNETVPTLTSLKTTEPKASPNALAATPAPSSSPKAVPNPVPPRSGGFPPTIVGAATAALLVLGVLAAKQARLHR